MTCGTRGPYINFEGEETEEDAVRAWNRLPRFEDFQCGEPYPISEGWEDCANVRCTQPKDHDGDHKSHKKNTYVGPSGTLADGHSSILPLRWAQE
jgi:hypothetical protein